jgi:DNA invertase Pin-like site-specific DNA recombinase
LEAAGCEYIYQEKISGKGAAGRAELQKLFSHLRPRDVVVVSKLDRLARSTQDLLSLFGRAAAAESSILSLAEPWADTSSPAGTLIVTVMAGIAEFERARILERCNEGRRVAKAAGRRLGRKPALSAERAELVSKALKGGARASDIALVYGVAESTIYRLKRANV